MARTGKIAWILILFGVVCIVTEIVLGFRILPLHISVAIGSYFFFLMCIVSCLFIRKKHACSIAIASSEVGIANAVLTLVSGSIWAHYAWGVYWVWEPRLTGMLLTTMFFISWRLAVGIMGETAVRNKKLTASLIILGIPGMFFTHVAVRFFGGIHPSGTHALNSAPVLWWAFVLMGVGVAAVSAGMFLYRYAMLFRDEARKRKGE
ncbi:MAG: cytochrome c biogenesis protein CcsA [Proteobacteria bacterium]|nr:cytochrome c biogenesis protein CcsA [Pseudomonadota bacterium]